MGLRLDISGNRGTYRGRIGGGVDREKGGSGEVVFRRGLRREWGDYGARVLVWPAGKFIGKFSKKFFGDYFLAGKIFEKNLYAEKYFRKKLCSGPEKVFEKVFRIFFTNRKIFS